MPQRKTPKKKGPASHREVSVLAWIQDAYGNVLMVEQASGRKLWSLPGGKVQANEPLLRALRRELREEIGLSIISAEVIDLFDRPAKGGLAVLFRAVLRKGKIKVGDTEIQTAAFLRQLPVKSTPSVRYFWARHFAQKSSQGNILTF